MTHNDQLLIPDAVNKDPKSIEILRVWVANNGQHFSSRAGIWDDPAAWGIMLSDLARHIAYTYQEDMGLDRHKVLQRIKASLDVELSSPTDKVNGG